MLSSQFSNSIQNDVTAQHLGLALGQENPRLILLKFLNKWGMEKPFSAIMHMPWKEKNLWHYLDDDASPLFTTPPLSLSFTLPLPLPLSFSLCLKSLSVFAWLCVSHTCLGSVTNPNCLSVFLSVCFLTHFSFDFEYVILMNSVRKIRDLSDYPSLDSCGCITMCSILFLSNGVGLWTILKRKSVLIQK